MRARTADLPPTWTLVVPVKVLAHAKSRLSDLAGPYRPALALAMAQDTVAAALASPEVARVVVVTGDPVAGPGLAAVGAVVVPDGADGGLNAALRVGAAFAAAHWPGDGVGALTGDLPALRPAELARGLLAAARWPHAFVSDASGTGTTLYAVRPGGDFRPRFGADSAARHRADGAAEVSLDGLASLRRDVDVAADLRAAAQLGLGARTTAAVAMLAPL